jgi:cation diffusion facilitator family transporter
MALKTTFIPLSIAVDSTLGSEALSLYMPEQGAREPKGQDHVRRVVHVTLVGLGVNVSLGILKLAAGLIGSSQAVVADAVHTFSDVSTDLAVLIGVRYWSQPPDEGHPHGHGRVETAVTMLIGLVLCVFAFGLGYKALATLSDRHMGSPGPIALAAACVSIVSKEILYRWTVSVGKRVRSSAMVANAWHHRSDGLSSIPVALAVGGAIAYPAWRFLDHIGAVVVSLFLVQAAWKIGWPAVKQLMDSAAPLRVRQRISALAMMTPRVKRVHAIRTRYLGPALHVDLHIMVDGGLTLREGHDISEAVKERLIAEGPDVLDVVVHTEPYEGTEEPS